MVQQRLGPGSYDFEKTTASSLLSQNKKITATRFYPSESSERLKFNITKTPGPGRYDYEAKLNRMSNFSEINSHKISQTKRSDIVYKNSNLAPGYYDW